MNPSFTDKLNKPTLTYEVLLTCTVNDTFPEVEECPKYCTEIFKVLAKTKILGKDEKDAVSRLRMVNNNRKQLHEMVVDLAVKLTPNINHTMEQNMWEKCCKFEIFQACFYPLVKIYDKNRQYSSVVFTIYGYLETLILHPEVIILVYDLPVSDNE
jgi:hypothetical protein